VRKRGSGKRKRLKMMFDVYEHGDARVEKPAKKGSLEPTHAVLFTQGCVFLEQTCRSSGLNPANERYATSVPTQYLAYVTENFTFSQEARRLR
jgi:hypothetical protein